MPAQYEVELKFRLDHGDPFRVKLLELAQPTEPPVRHRDEYFNHPSRNFAETDEAFRIRSIGAENRVTYKGPLVDTESKTRREIEIPFQQGDTGREQYRDMLLLLGFQSVFVVEKQRESFHMTWRGQAVELALDTVDDLGDFVELEMQCGFEEIEATRNRLWELAKSLGLEVQERRSYLRLLLAQQNET